MFSELNDVSYYALLSKVSAVFCAFLVVTLAFFIKRAFVNRVLRGKSVNELEMWLIAFLLISAIVSYFCYDMYAQRVAWIEVKPRYNEYVKTAKPQYACASYKGTSSRIRGRRFLFDDGSYITGYDYGDSAPALVHSLKRDERVCVKYVVIPPFLRPSHGHDKKILDLSRSSDAAECENECKLM